MGEDEILVNVDGLLIVLCCLGEFTKDEVKLSTVVVDVRVFLVLLDRFLKVVRRRVLVTCRTVSMCQKYDLARCNLPCSKCMLARLT